MMAASVSTRVVSWKEAAEMNESVDSDALVMPSSMLSYVAGFLPSLAGLAVVLVQQFGTLDLLAGMKAVSPGSADLDAAQHLAHDHLDVLVVDLHALQTVDVLDLVDDVARQRLDALQAQDVVRIGRAVDDHLALVDHLAVVHQHVLVLGDQEFVATPSSR
jgi:hypothetical protein